MFTIEEHRCTRFRKMDHRFLRKNNKSQYLRKLTEIVANCRHLWGAATLSITTFSLKTLSITTFNLKTLSKTTFSPTSLSTTTLSLRQSTDMLNDGYAQCHFTKAFYGDRYAECRCAICAPTSQSSIFLFYGLLSRRQFEQTTYMDGSLGDMCSFTCS